MATSTQAPQMFDLFGGQLQPGQVAANQISESIQNAQNAYAGNRPPVRTAAMLGAGIGGLFRQVLMDNGVLPKDPEQQAAERAANIKTEANAAADKAGVNIVSNPDAYADLVATTAMKYGDDATAAKAVQLKLMLQAQRNAAALQQSNIQKNTAGAIKDVAEANKANAEAAAMPEMNAAKLDALKSQASLNAAKEKNYNILTSLKANDPTRAIHQKVDTILTDFQARLKKNPNANYTAGERKVLDEAARIGVMDKIMGGAMLGGAVTGGAEAGAPAASADHFDYSK